MPLRRSRVGPARLCWDEDVLGSLHYGEAQEGAGTCLHTAEQVWRCLFDAHNWAQPVGISKAHIRAHEARSATSNGHRQLGIIDHVGSCAWHDCRHEATVKHAAHAKSNHEAGASDGSSAHCHSIEPKACSCQCIYSWLPGGASKECRSCKPSGSLNLTSHVSTTIFDCVENAVAK